jgi:arabinogalactan endo-1,4-beta-galactosidase
MFKKSIKRIITGLLGLSLLVGSISIGSTPTTVQAASNFAKGADIGWLNQLENNGVKWVNDKGVQEDALEILKDNGINSVRLRVFVNPPSNFQWTKKDGSTCMLGYADTTGVIYMAKRAKALGMKVMIDFHYSDHFADPAYQDTPVAWVNHDVKQLKNDVYSHTHYVMTALKNAGVTPEWAQIGNETNSGMLWPTAGPWNFKNWAELINSGYDAIKSVSPSSKTIVQLSNGADNALYRSVFDGLTKAGTKFDVIGLSYYPYWNGVDYTKNIDGLESNINDMVTRYGKEVMISEIGGLENDPDNTYKMIKKVIKIMKDIPGKKGLGVFYWEPEANSSVLPDKYPLGATTKVSDNVLKFSRAIHAFK